MNQSYPYSFPGGQYAPVVAPPPQANAFETHIQEDLVPFTAVREGYPYLYLFSLDQLAKRQLNSKYRKVKVADRAYCVVYKAGWGAGGQPYASSIEEVFALVQQ
ncbi:hypothetical protein B0H14DRAFT_3429290 [Mycena olivaceomarginata]|nr:hypothetical protein B0H14DRAFT_3429290 [Mycena olivaceomarginata]